MSRAGIEHGLRFWAQRAGIKEENRYVVQGWLLCGGRPLTLGVKNGFIIYME